MTIKLIHGDCRDALKVLPTASVQCVVTSPPYLGLRDYGTATWSGGDPDHEHDRVGARNGRGGAGSPGKNTVDAFPSTVPAMACSCGAVRTDRQIGMEASPAEFVAQMVEVFAEVWRVLRDDGVMFLNLGDGYNNFRVSKGPGQAVHGRDKLNGKPAPDSGPRGSAGFKEKDLLMIPARVAIALQDWGWYLRQDNVWAKRNCMPESVQDRTTRAHEYVFMLTKRPNYFYDAKAIEEDGEIPAGTRAAKGSNVRSATKEVNGRPPEYYEYTGKRNKRSVWFIATQPYPDAHFAVMAPELAEVCIKAGTPEVGCCRICAAPWERLLRKDRSFESGSGRSGNMPVGKNGQLQGGGETLDVRRGPCVETTTIGWAMTCDCPIATPIPSTVLDPFGGAGTSALVADRLKRDAVLIELNADYVQIINRRITKDAGLFAEIANG